MNDRQKIDSCKELFVTSIYEPVQNKLVLEIAIGQVSEAEVDFSISDKTLRGRPLFFDDQSDKYRLSFDSYVSYFVLNESYDAGMNGDYVGDRIREYNQSAFIDFCKTETSGYALLDDKLVRHFVIVAQNHIVHVLTVSQISIEPKDG